MSWQPEINEIRRRERAALAMGGEERVARQKAAGRLTVRERIDRFLDPGTFEEIGSLSGFVDYDEDGNVVSEMASNIIIGTGRVEGRTVVVAADDFTIRGGAADAAIHEKQVHAEQLAGELRHPIVRLIDGTGGGGSVKTLEQIGRTYVPYNPGWDQIVANLGRVPVLAAALGPVAGLGAARAVTSHFSVMVKHTSQLFIAGPPVVQWAFGREVGKEELGGWEIHTRESGAIDNAAEDEEHAFEQLRWFLSFLPSSVHELPPVERCDDPVDRREEELLSLIPRNRRQPHDARRLLDLVFDDGSVFETGRGYGGSVITALARLDGHPVAVVTEDPTEMGGGLTSAGAEKLTRHVDLAETFHLPLVHLVDQPGFVVGIDAERTGTLRAGARALAAIYQATIPQFSVIVRRVFGVAGAGHSNHARAQARVAWPSADWGSLPLEGGIEAAYKRDLAAADDPEALLEEIRERLDHVRDPVRTAEAFGIERMIDPRDTRPILCAWVRDAYRVLSHDAGPRTHGMRP